MTRKRPSPADEAIVLTKCARRCALCFGLSGRLEEVAGQIAHVDQNSSNSTPENLAFLCFDHHDEYDSQTSQSKGFTPLELKYYRERLHEAISSGDHHRNSEQQISVVSHNQQGGVTAGVVNISNTPEPELKMREVFLNRRTDDGDYHSRVELTLESPYPPGNLYVEVRGHSVKRIALTPQMTGCFVSGHSGVRRDMAFTNLQHPPRVMHLDIFTRDSEVPLEIDWNV